MSRPKRILATLGIIVVTLLALIGLLSITRGTPLRHVTYAAGERSPAVSDPQFLSIMELFAGVHLKPGNRVEQLLNGDGTYPRLWADLRGAQTSITVQMYYAKPGAVADTMAAILAERARAGVRVLLLLDAFGTQSMKQEWADAMREAGVDVQLLRELRWYSVHNAADRSHVRVVVVDGRIGYTGGFGLADYWLGDGLTKDHWRETNVRFEGPAVMELQAAFAAAWVEATGILLVEEEFFPPSAFSANVGPSVAGLLFTATTTGSTAAERFLALSIAGARRTLYVANAYFVPDDDFRAGLIAAARRGTDVRILTVGPNTDIPTTWYAGRARYRVLLEGGVRIWEYQPTMMHAKTMVVDGQWSAVGSMNADNRSLSFNEETVLMMLDRNAAAVVERHFMDDLGFADEIRLETFRRRGLPDRIKEKVCYAFWRIL